MLQIVMAFAPLTFLIIYALKTRKMADAMVLATLLAMVLLHRQHFLTGTIDAMYAALSNSSYQFVLCIIIGFGDYLRAIPYMIYPLGMMLLCLLLAVGAFPKLGGLKRAYQRVQEGGPAFERDDTMEKLVVIAVVGFLLCGAGVF